MASTSSRVADGAVLGFVGGDARLGVGFVFAAQAENQMRDGLAKQFVLGLVARLEHGEPGDAALFQIAGLGQEAVALGVEDGAHISLGDGGDGAQNALFPAARAGAVAGDQRVVVGAHHEHIAQRGGLGVGGIGGVVEAEVLLRGVGQQIEEGGAGLVLGVDLLGLRNHFEGIVVAAGGDAGRAALAEIADKNGEDAAGAGGFALGRREDRRDLLIGHGNFVEECQRTAALALAEKPSTESVTSRRIVCSGVPVFVSATMRWRACLSISGRAASNLARSAALAT